jgi:PAS domain S-box-containing protein
MATSIKLLLIEDSEDDMLLLLCALQEGGYAPIYHRVQTPVAMAEALGKEAWDIVISDYFMPKFGALEALNLLQSHHLDIPFIVVSGAIGEDTAVALMRAGAQDVLLKENLARLVPAVERELREAQTRKAKREAEEALRHAYESLEILVQQRTAELEASNQTLLVEVAERTRAERLMAAQHNATQALVDSPSLADAAPKVLRAICKNLGWDLGQFWVIDTNIDELCLIQVWHSTSAIPSNLEPLLSTGNRQKGKGISGQIWVTKRPVWISDTTAVSRAAEIEAAIQAHLLTICGFPIVHAGEVLGVMTFFRRKIRQAEPELLNVMRTIGGQVGQFIKRRQAEEALHQLAAIVESSDDAIISTNLNWNIVSWNAGAEKMYGYSATTALGQNLGDLITAFNSQSAESELITTQQQVDHRQAVHRRKDGSLMDVFLTVSPVKDGLGRITGTSMIARDISDRREVEKMKDEFVSVVSHELRTPLTSIRGSLGLLLTGKLGDLSEEGKRFLQIAVSNTDRLVRLINDILDLERLKSGKIGLSLEVCNLGTLMTQATEVMQAMAEKAGVTLIVQPVDFQLKVDGDRILQTLTNLVSNAIKFSEPGCRVWLSAELVQHKALAANKSQGSNSTYSYESSSPTSRSSFITTPHLLIQVKDQGRGIPENKLESIFERFQQVDASDSRQKGGTGLGLAICRSILQQHGGEIWVESELGKGSTFFLALPIHQEVQVPACKSAFNQIE